MHVQGDSEFTTDHMPSRTLIYLAMCESVTIFRSVVNSDSLSIFYRVIVKKGDNSNSVHIDTTKQAESLLSALIILNFIHPLTKSFDIIYLHINSELY